MNFTPISALSPLDGRYASKLNALRPLMSEQGYMHRRVQVEIAWFIALSDAGFAEFKPLTPGARAYLTALVKNFSEADAVAIKAFEKVTNHDVKAVEYWIKSKFKDRPELEKAAAEKLAAAQGIAEKMAGLSVSVGRKAGMDGRLFGSVGTNDIANALKAVGFVVDKAAIRMPDGPLKAIGEFPLDVALHTDVVANITVAVVAE